MPAAIDAEAVQPAPAAPPPTTNGTNAPASQQAPPAAEEKLTNAQLKAKAKAEKAAKRAQAKTDQAPAAEAGSSRTNPPQSQQKQKQGQKEQQGGKDSAARPQQRSSQPAAQVSPSRPAQIREKIQPEPTPKENKNVALFGHLYTNPRRTTIAGNSKDVHPAVLALGLQMSNYVICGSSARCVATLLAFKRVIESYSTPTGQSLSRNLTALLSTQIDYLVSCRPLSISTGNAIRWLKVTINNIDIATPEDEAKQDLCDLIDSFIRERITMADAVIAGGASQRIGNGDTILTYSKSNVVLQTLLKAYEDGKTFKVIVIDSRPLFEGKNLARTLSLAGLDVTYSLTHATTHLMKSVSKVFLGAHGMFSNGRLYSRIGTAMIAMTAHSLSKPVLVLCESVKFTDRVALDSIVLNEVLPPDELLLPKKAGELAGDAIGNNGSGSGKKGQTLEGWKDLPNLQILDLMYDVTPSGYIDMVVTEYGSLPPSSVMSIHRLSLNT